MKRYNIINMYIRGSNVSPQVSHGLNNLWKSRDDMTRDAKALFDNWANHSQTEINLQGGSHADMEALYDALQKIPNIPSAKFNESQEALCGACTVVTFVNSERIVAINDYIRNNRIPHGEAYDILKDVTMYQLGLESYESSTLTKDQLNMMNQDQRSCLTHNQNACVTKEEVFVATYISRLRTAN